MEWNHTTPSFVNNTVLSQVSSQAQILAMSTESSFLLGHSLKRSQDGEPVGVSPVEVKQMTKRIKKLKIPKDEGSLPLIIRTLSGKKLDLIVPKIATISELKEKIEESEGIPPHQQRLVFEGKTMADEQKLCTYGVTIGSVIYLVLALRGGK
jgi:hypothetical protein